MNAYYITPQLVYKCLEPIQENGYSHSVLSKNNNVITFKANVFRNKLDSIVQGTSTNILIGALMYENVTVSITVDTPCITM